MRIKLWTIEKKELMKDKAILCVDDEKVVLDSLRDQLRAYFKDSVILEFAESSDEALEIIDELNEEEIKILLIISDWLMPGMKGDEFLSKIHKRFPKITKVLLTGQADPQAIEKAKSSDYLNHLLQKPWESSEIIKIVKDTVGAA